MKTIIKSTLVLSILFQVQFCLAQSLSPKTIASAGGVFTAGGNSLSWTLGEPFHTTLSAGGVILTQGFQQPFSTVNVLNLKAFIEGFYIGSGQMASTIDPSNPTTSCD